MSDTVPPPRSRASRISELIAVAIIAVLVLLALIYGAMRLYAKHRGQAEPSPIVHTLGPGSAADVRPPASLQGKLNLLPQPAPGPTASFGGPDGKPRALADFKGKVVVMNLWATWCAPCLKEMPTLAVLQKDVAAKGVAVVPVSTDGDADIAKARAVIVSHAPLVFYSAPVSWVFALKPPAQGFPTTIIYDRQGRERARITGDVDWTGAPARALVDRFAAEKG